MGLIASENMHLCHRTKYRLPVSGLDVVLVQNNPQFTRARCELCSLAQCCSTRCASTLCAVSAPFRRLGCVERPVWGLEINPQSWLVLSGAQETEVSYSCRKPRSEPSFSLQSQKKSSFIQRLYRGLMFS